MKKYWILLSIALVAGSAAYFVVRHYQAPPLTTLLPTSTPTSTPSETATLAPSPSPTPTPVPTPTPTPRPTITPTPTPSPSLPATVSLSVPFISQAPAKVWDSIHEDTCEEASLTMLRHFLHGTEAGSIDDQEAELHTLVQWEDDHSYGPSISLEDLSTVAKEVLSLNSGTVKTATETALKKELAAGHPVIIGAAGKLLHNPHFKNGGPNYHMLVIKGYDDTGFITNDPGTQYGESYHYSYAVLMNAIHDWTTGDITQGAARYLVF